MEKSLRTQFMDYMTLNRYSPWTIQHYMDIVKRLAKYFNKSPDLITQEEIQEYLLYLYWERKLDWGTCNALLLLDSFSENRSTTICGMPFQITKSGK